jgi:alpha-glucosidase
VLTDRLLRLEHAPDGVFEDRPSMAVVNRRFPRVPFEVRRPGPGQLVVDTGAIRLECQDTSRPFSRRTLGARIGRGRSATRWTFGQRDRGNLGGTRRTLDGWRGAHRQKMIEHDRTTGRVVMGDWLPQQLDPGLLSRRGWVVVDDSESVVFEPRRGVPGGVWPTPRPAGRRQDVYLLAYGTDHAGALRDASCLLGPQPLPPRFAFGYWYSRYYAYTDREVQAIAEQHDEAGIPLDVVVIDMDWHLPGWTGYSWDERYFPDPAATLDRLHDRGLRVALNLHPADGVGRHEAAFPAMCAAMDLDPATTDRVPFDATDPRFVDAYLRLLHHPQEDLGVDVWWMDWQQGKTSGIPGLDPLPWLNRIHWDDQARRRPRRRPLIFSRWGGLGGGRYPMGFSGDTWSVWESLEYQTEFTATAANVLYGYWSHDVGGHYGPATTPELYTRWMQSGLYSPILRTHGTKDPSHERRIWEFADPYRSAMVDAVRRRYELVPYVYGACRKGIESGRSLVRPMYHDHPDQEEAYRSPNQVCFGSTMVVAPVVEPVDATDHAAPTSVWLPPGRWYDTALGSALTVRHASGARFERRYLIDEVPCLVPAGAVVPEQRDATRLDAPCYPHLVVVAYPGGDGEHVLYEDDGISDGYQRGRSVDVPLVHRTTARGREVRVGPARGGYRGWDRRRPLDVRFVGEPPPIEVTVGDRSLRRSSGPAAGRWWYEADTATVVVRLRADLRARTVVRARRDAAVRPADLELLDGRAGIARRLDRIAAIVGLVSPHYSLHPDERLAVDLAQAGRRIELDPASWIDELRRVRREVRRLDGVLAEFQDAWRTAVVPPFSDPRERSVALLTEARGRVVGLVEQFGLGGR